MLYVVATVYGWDAMYHERWLFHLEEMGEAKKEKERQAEMQEEEEEEKRDECNTVQHTQHNATHGRDSAYKPVTHRVYSVC